MRCIAFTFDPLDAQVGNGTQLALHDLCNAGPTSPVLAVRVLIDEFAQQLDHEWEVGCAVAVFVHG